MVSFLVFNEIFGLCMYKKKNFFLFHISIPNQRMDKNITRFSWFLQMKRSENVYLFSSKLRSSQYSRAYMKFKVFSRAWVLRKFCSIKIHPSCHQTGSVIFNVFRGKGDNYRLGHGTEEHIRLPKQIERFNGKKVKDISVGSMHCLAVTDDGEVYGWGRNEQGQLGDMTIQCRTEPTRLPGLEGKNIVGAACGPSQV